MLSLTSWEFHFRKCQAYRKDKRVVLWTSICIPHNHKLTFLSLSLSVSVNTCTHTHTHTHMHCLETFESCTSCFTPSNLTSISKNQYILISNHIIIITAIFSDSKKLSTIPWYYVMTVPYSSFLSYPKNVFYCPLLQPRFDLDGSPSMFVSYVSLVF
jgi:hypothetical protein